MNRPVPLGYESTEVWRLFELWCDNHPSEDKAEEVFWEAFRDGFSAGLFVSEQEAADELDDAP